MTFHLSISLYVASEVVGGWRGEGPGPSLGRDRALVA